MTTRRILLAAIAGLALAASGCGKSSDFDADKAKSILEAKPINLDGELVTLTKVQVDCGVQSELWESPTQVSEALTSAHLNAKARDLKFSDDVQVEPKYRQPHAQVRGDVMLQVDEVTSVRDGEAGAKLVDAKAGIKIQHACFQAPLPIMGVKKGDFREDTPPSFLFRFYDDGWHVEKLVH